MTDITPIEIIVSNGRWNAFGPLTDRSQYLISVLNLIGGVADSVADGTYYFNVKTEGMTVVAFLTPVNE